MSGAVFKIASAGTQVLAHETSYEDIRTRVGETAEQVSKECRKFFTGPQMESCLGSAKERTEKAFKELAQMKRLGATPLQLEARGQEMMASLKSIPKYTPTKNQDKSCKNSEMVKAIARAKPSFNDNSIEKPASRPQTSRPEAHSVTNELPALCKTNPALVENTLMGTDAALDSSNRRTQQLYSCLVSHAHSSLPQNARKEFDERFDAVRETQCNKLLKIAESNQTFQTKKAEMETVDQDTRRKLVSLERSVFPERPGRCEELYANPNTNKANANASQEKPFLKAEKQYAASSSSSVQITGPDLHFPPQEKLLKCLSEHPLTGLSDKQHILGYHAAQKKINEAAAKSFADGARYPLGVRIGATLVLADLEPEIGVQPSTARLLENNLVKALHDCAKPISSAQANRNKKQGDKHVD